MSNFIKNLSNLVKVKTIVTILLTIVFCVLALNGTISGADFLTVFTVVIAFYFGTQHEKTVSEPDTTKAPTEPTGTVALDDGYIRQGVIDPTAANEAYPLDNDTVVTGFAG